MLFDLFLTIFGIPYLIAKYISEKYKVSKADKEYQEKRAKIEMRKAQWVLKVTNPELEEQYRCYIRGNLSEAFEGILGVWSEIGNDIGWFPKDMSEFETRHKEMILRIMLGRDGYLMKKDAEEGIPTCTYRYLYRQQIKVDKGYVLNMFNWLNAQLQAKGIFETTYTASLGYYFEPPLPPNECYDPGYRLIWEPQTDGYKSVTHWGRRRDEEF